MSNRNVAVTHIVCIDHECQSGNSGAATDARAHRNQVLVFPFSFRALPTQKQREQTY